MPARSPDRGAAQKPGAGAADPQQPGFRPQAQTPAASEAEAGFRRRVLAATLIVLSIVALAALLLRHPEIPLLVFGAILGAVFLDALARPLRSWLGLSQMPAVAGAVLLVLAICAGLLAWVGPQLYQQGGQLVERVPEMLAQLERQVPQPVREALPDAASSAGVRGWQRLASWIFGSLGGLFTTSAGILAGLLAWLALAIFLAMRPALYREGALRLLPPARRARAGEVLGAIARALRWWLVGRGTAMAIVGVLTGVSLALLGIPLAMSLALLAAVFTFVPYVGPLLAAAPAVLLALADSPQQALIVALLYWGIQLFENYVITPLVQGRTVSLPPAVLILAQVSLGVLLGGLGLLLATPVAVAGIVLVQALYLQDVLGEPVRLLGEGARRQGGSARA